MTNKKDNKMVDDTNKDGLISIEEMNVQKADEQMRLARIALFAMIAMAAYLVSPFSPPIELLNALQTVLSTFFVGMASVVGAYMGFSTWLSKK